MARSSVKRRLRGALGPIGLAMSVACVGGNGDDPNVTNFTFEPITAGDTLQAADVDAIMMTAAEAVDHPNIAIAIVDRVGNLLRLYNRTPSGFVNPMSPVIAGDPAEMLDIENKFAVAHARAAAYLSHSQAPLTSRTGQFLSTFHFPGVFDTATFVTEPDGPDVYAMFTPPINPTIGVANTPQAPLWQIDASNRGGMDQLNYNPGMSIPVLVNPDGSRPTPGFGPLPGGVPLYKTPIAAVGVTPPPNHVAKRAVGAIGVYAWDVGTPPSGTDPMGVDAVPRPDIMEFVAVTAVGTESATVPVVPPATMAENYFFPVPIPPAGAVYLVGILLPAFDPPIRPADTGPGMFDAADVVCTGDPGAPGDPSCVAQLNGQIDPFPDLVGPDPSNNPPAVMGPGGGLAANEVAAILEGCRRASEQTHAAIRLPPNAACQMVISVCDLDGVIIGVYREPDATLFSLEISVSKARNAVYFSKGDSRDMGPDAPFPGEHPLFSVFQDPLGDDAALGLITPAGNPNNPGIAVTARTLGFLSQPFYPPTIDGSGVVGPLHHLVDVNRNPAYFDCQGHEFDPTGLCNQRSGVIFFPGSAPLYKEIGGVQTLVGGLGVSGDGVEQDDFVTALGIQFAEEALELAGSPIDLEPPPEIRVDNFSYDGVKIPYLKFPQNPGG